MDKDKRFGYFLIVATLSAGFVTTLIVIDQDERREGPPEGANNFSTDGYPEENLTWANGTPPANPTRPTTGR